MSVYTTDNYVDIDKLVSEAEQFVERRNPEALPLAERVMQHAIQNGNTKYFAQAKYILAFYYCMVANDYEKAIKYCEEVLEKLDDDETLGIGPKLYMTMGNSYQLKGDVFKAQDSYLKGLKQMEAKSELTIKEKNFLGSFYYNLSLVLTTTELNISSEEYLEQAIKIFEEIDSGFKLSKSYVAYAGVYERKKEYRKAIELLFKSLEIDVRMNDPYSIALSKANLGILHLRIRDFDKAFFYIKDALDFYDSKQMLYETAMVRMNLGDALCIIGQIAEGMVELHKAEDLFTRQENKRELNHIFELLAKHKEESGDLKAALDYKRKYIEGLRYFFDVEKTKALTHAKKEFETEQKEKEAALLRQKNDEINHYVMKLEGSNNELKQFAHVASHDLREPLRMITSYLMLLQKSMGSTITERQKEFMDFATDGAKRMEILIHDMLRLAKVDANPRIEEVKLSSVIDEIKLNLEMLIKERNALVVLTDLPVISADRTMMLQLFQNLIGNGIKYNDSGAPIIKLKYKITRDTLEITVTDNGIGIPQHLRERAFQMFQRVHTDKNYKGSGIGLAICKKIAETMNGRIAIEDNHSGGSVFRIILPVAAMVRETTTV